MKEVTPAEWLTLASGEYDVGTYTLIQKHLLILAIRSVPSGACRQCRFSLIFSQLPGICSQLARHAPLPQNRDLLDCVCSGFAFKIRFQVGGRFVGLFRIQNFPRVALLSKLFIENG